MSSWEVQILALLGAVMYLSYKQSIEKYPKSWFAVALYLSLVVYFILMLHVGGWIAEYLFS